MRPTPAASLCCLPLVLACLLVGAVHGSSDDPVHPDDPLAREPETQDASGVQPIARGRVYEVARALAITRTATPTGVRAHNANSIDEVPESSWFGAADAMPAADVPRTPPAAVAPGSPLRVTAVAPGPTPRLTARDADGRTWDVVIDPARHPEGVTGTTVVVSALLRQFGYNHARWSIHALAPDQLVPAAGATITTRTGRVVALRAADIGRLLRSAAARADGTCRVAMAPRPHGERLGAFRFRDTRPDDPNDVIPHEHRRELRGLRVVAAWLNLTRIGPRMTQDVLEPAAGGRRIVRHYLEGAGMGLGFADGRPHDPGEGFEYLFDPAATLQRLWTFGMRRPGWHDRDAPPDRTIGRLPDGSFDPRAWRPLVPNQAFVEMRTDDAFWAARRIAAFSDARLREVVSAAGFSTASASERLLAVLVARRDAIARTWLAVHDGIVEPSLSPAGVLRFTRAAVDAGLAQPARTHHVRWGVLDTATGATAFRGRLTTDDGDEVLPDVASLPVGANVRVEVSGDSSDDPEVTLTFRRTGDAWTLVALRRRGPHLVEAL